MEVTGKIYNLYVLQPVAFISFYDHLGLKRNPVIYDKHCRYILFTFSRPSYLLQTSEVEKTIGTYCSPTKRPYALTE